MFLGTLRKMAGVGRLSNTATTVDRTDIAGHRKTTPSPKTEYDTIVVGAGLSGRAAAVAAAEDGASVLLVDEYGQPGGNTIGFHSDDQRMSARDNMIARLRATRSIDYLPRTTAQAFYPARTLLLGPGGGVSPSGDPDASPTIAAMYRVRASSFVFATGAYDVVPIFENNDTPGVFGSRAIRLLIERDGLLPASRAVVYGIGPQLEASQQFLAHHGINTVAAIDAADSTLVRASGGQWLSSVTVASRKNGASETIRCDMMCIALPGQPAYELAYQAGFKFEMSGDEITETRTMQPTKQSIQNDDGVSFFVVGELAGQTTWKLETTAGEKVGREGVIGVQTRVSQRRSDL
jgi:NADPH-dependent 2,4-dienoyl-CoA reductase/sulfur reductase-like enzyme